MFILIAFIFPSTVSAQVVINEFSSGTSSNDWVEIYNFNIATQSADLSIYRLENKTGNTKNLSTLLVPGVFKVFTWSNMLNNSGDIIKLIRISDNTVLGEIAYGDQGGVCAPSETQSIGRNPDGTAKTGHPSDRGL